MTREFPREPLRRTANLLQGVGGIQRPAFRRTVEYLDRRLTGLCAVKSIAGIYLSVDFTTDVMRAIEIRRPVAGKFTVDVSTVNSHVENFEGCSDLTRFSRKRKKKNLELKKKSICVKRIITPIYSPVNFFFNPEERLKAFWKRYIRYLFQDNL